MNSKTVGIIGGMGPEATVDLMNRVIKATPAVDDGDHIRMLVDNNPGIPSRIRALIEGTGESPGPCLAEMGRSLEAWGADFLAIPCNTAHYYYEEIAGAVNIPVLNMIELAVERLVRENPGIRRVGLLASPAVLKTELYTRSFLKQGVELIYPAAGLQDALLAAIRGIKSGSLDKKVISTVQAVSDHLAGRDAQALLIACTELSIIADRILWNGKKYDSSQILAETIVLEAKGKIARK
jgi:aspartate racemase